MRAAAFSAGGDGGRKPHEQSFPPPTFCERRHRGLARRLVAPTPSMRFVSAHFGAQTGRCRGPCQLKTSQQQASQQLRHHFVAVQAFAFACPKVPGRVGPFLRSPFLSHAKRGKTAAVPLTVAERNPLLNGGLAINSDRQFKKIKHQSAQAAESGGLSVGWRRPGPCLSRTTLSR